MNRLIKRAVNTAINHTEIVDEWPIVGEYDDVGESRSGLGVRLIVSWVSNGKVVTGVIVGETVELEVTLSVPREKLQGQPVSRSVCRPGQTSHG